jgi:hypothetical protein
LLDARIAGVETAIARSRLRTTTMLLAGAGAMIAVSRLIH